MHALVIIVRLSLMLYVLQHLCEDEEVKTVQIPVPSKPVNKYPAVFRWTGTGEEVSIAGTFNSWRGKIPLVKRLANIYLDDFLVDKQLKVDGKCFVLITEKSLFIVMNCLFLFVSEARGNSIRLWKCLRGRISTSITLMVIGSAIQMRFVVSPQMC